MSDKAVRKSWMSVLAKAPAAELAKAWEALGLNPDHDVLRAPEVGGVMIRGRAGATGASFNLGEMTVTRCSLRLADGVVGHGYVQGRDKAQAKTAALVDALMQTDAADQVRKTVLEPLEAAMNDARASRKAKAAATKVEFFTMVRGED
ncbi:MAG: phosphonate C-P lyase system protein PhnG [Pseudomonadota bacterium]